MKQFFRMISRALRARPVLAFAVFSALAVVFVLFAAAPAAAQSTPPAPYGCELVLTPVWHASASVPAGGELTVPSAPTGASIFCVDGVASGEAGAIELTHSAVFTATVGSTPVSLNIVGANLGAALPLDEVQQGYGVVFAPRSPVPSVTLVDSADAGLADIRLFWGTPKTAAGRPMGQLGNWKKFVLAAGSNEIAWVEKSGTVKVRGGDTYVLDSGVTFEVEGYGAPTCTKRCVLSFVPATSPTELIIKSSLGGWVGLYATGAVGSTVELWVPSGTPAAATAAALDPKGGDGFPGRHPHPRPHN